MGRSARPKVSPEATVQLEALSADNARLEAERVAVLALPRTVANQIAHAWISVRLLSNLRSAAMLRGKVGEVVALTGALDKTEATLRGLQKNRIDDELGALVARIQGHDDARAILAAAEDDA